MWIPSRSLGYVWVSGNYCMLVVVVVWVRAEALPCPRDKERWRIVLSEERRARIAAELKASQGVRTEDLSALLGVSQETIRRDFSTLEDEGLLRRVHGGAMPIGQRVAVEEPYRERTASNVAGKKAMARVAAGLIHNNDTVILDVGTSILEIARAIPLDWSGLVLTNSISVATELSTRRKAQIMVAGGMLREGDLSTSGQYARDLFSDYFADIAFIGSGGLSVQGGLSDYPHLDEATVKRVMIHNAHAAYAVVDATKFNVTAARKVCALADLTGVVSDGSPDEGLTEALADADVEILTPAQNTTKTTKGTKLTG